MHEIAFKNVHSLSRGRRVIALTEKNEKEGKTVITQKAFIYVVKRLEGALPAVETPEYFFTKWNNTKTQEERFSVRARGNSYLIQEGIMYKVSFCHFLKIDIKPSDITV